jgi:hypothetical protein
LATPLIAQICARRELWHHALLGEQNGGYAPAFTGSPRIF